MEKPHFFRETINRMIWNAPRFTRKMLQRRTPCRDGGIGKRSGLKIRRWQHLASSRLAPGTRKTGGHDGVAAFFPTRRAAAAALPCSRPGPAGKGQRLPLRSCRAVNRQSRVSVHTASSLWETCRLCSDNTEDSQ